MHRDPGCRSVAKLGFPGVDRIREGVGVPGGPHRRLQAAILGRWVNKNAPPDGLLSECQPRLPSAHPPQSVYPEWPQSSDATAAPVRNVPNEKVRSYALVLRRRVILIIATRQFDARLTTESVDALSARREGSSVSRGPTPQNVPATSGESHFLLLFSGHAHRLNALPPSSPSPSPAPASAPTWAATG